MAQQDQNPRGAVRLGGRGSGGDRRKGGLGAILLTALLLVAVIVAVVLILSGGNDKPRAAKVPAPTPTAPSSTSPAPGGAGSGELKAADKPLLPTSRGSFTALVGQTAIGSGVEVQSVNRGAGFWVGSSTQDRVYIEYGAGTGQAETARYTPKVGDRVNLTGEARPAPRDPVSALNIDPVGAELIDKQDGFVNAESVKRAP